MFRAMKPLTFLGFAAITVIATPIAEELAFRHILYRLFRMFLYRRESAVVVSLIFALCHVSVATMFQTKPFPWEMLVVPVIPLFLLALFLQRQYEKSKSIIPSTLIHAGFNLISVFLLILEVYYGVGE
jgi:membrane protease YdiL (CAAX protease family)